MDITAERIFYLIYLPKVIFWCAVFAYEGFVNDSTLTHGGFKSGLIAKFYGVFYTIFLVLSILFIPVYLRELLQTDWGTIKQSLLYVEPVGVGLFSLSIAAVSFLLKIIILRKSTRARRMNKSAHKVFNSMLFFFIAAGIQNLISSPQWVLLAIFTFFAYFGAFLSPKTVINAMKPDAGNNFSYFRKVEKSRPAISRVESI